MAGGLKSKHFFPILKRLQSSLSPAPKEQAVAAVPRTLDNGLAVASIDDGWRATRIAVAISAGPRYERADQLGVTHYLRLMASEATKKSTALGLTRANSQIGTDLACITTHEYMVYMMQTLREHTEQCVNTIRRVVTLPAVNFWDVHALQPRLHYDLAVLKQRPNVMMTEMLHDAAYRDTLGNSLYVPEAKIGHFTSENLAEYMEDNYCEGRVTLVGTGINHDDINRLGSEFKLHPRRELQKSAPIFRGGERRHHTQNPMVYAGLCTEGTGYTSNDVYSSWVLQAIMGTGPRVHWSRCDGVSRLGKALGQVGEESSIALSCINVNYSDTGLFGFCLASEYTVADKLMKAAFDEFKSLAKGEISEEELKKGKTVAKAGLCMYMENNENILCDLGEQMLLKGNITTLKEMSKKIDGVTQEGVSEFAKKLQKGKLAMSAVGNVTRTPYLDSFLWN